MQNAQFELADMLATVEAIRALAYYSAYLYDAKSPEFMLMSHVTKLHAARLAVDVTRRAVQMEGALVTVKKARRRCFIGTPRYSATGYIVAVCVNVEEGRLKSAKCPQVLLDAWRDIQ